MSCLHNRYRHADACKLVHCLNQRELIFYRDGKDCTVCIILQEVFVDRRSVYYSYIELYSPCINNPEGVEMDSAS